MLTISLGDDFPKIATDVPLCRTIELAKREETEKEEDAVTSWIHISESIHKKKDFIFQILIYTSRKMRG
jgi:hypothetical protein